MKKLLIIFLLMTGSALADVTGAGSTTNTQSTTGTSATNTAITGDITVKQQQTISLDLLRTQQLQTQQTTITTPIQETLGLCLQHLLLASLLCLKICVLLALV